MGTLVKNQTPVVAFDGRNQKAHSDNYHSLRTSGDAGDHVAIAAPLRSGRTVADTYGDQGNVIRYAMSVRRLTPRECCRLQGFPSDYTLIPYKGKPAADGPRYKALGNSMAVPVVEYILRRIGMVR